MTLTTRKSLPLRYSNRFSSNPFPLNGLQFYADLWNVEQQGFLLSYDGNDKLAAIVANLRSADSLGTYELTGFKSSSTANDQTLIASCNVAVTTTTFFSIYVALTTGRVTISTQENGGTVNTQSGTTNVCDGLRKTIHVKSSGTAWSILVNGVVEAIIDVAGDNTGDWFADIGIVADRDNVTHGVKTTTGDGSWAIAEMGQHRLYSRELSDAECLTNHQRGRKATPSDATGLVYNLPCQEGTGNPVETIAAVNPTLTGATWVEGLMDRSTNAYAITTFGSPAWSNQGRAFVGASSQSLRIPDSANLDFVDAITIGGWFKPGLANTEQYLITKGDRAVAINYLISITAGNYFAFEFFTTPTFYTDADTTTVLSVGTWYHLFATYDKVNVLLYINGNLVKTISRTPVLTVNALDLFVAREGSAPGTYYTGDNGEDWLYNRVLSAQEITQIYNAGKDLPRYRN